MSLFHIIIFMFLIYVCYRASARHDERRQNRHKDRHMSARVDELTDRIQVLERILIDRDRRLRDDFRGI